MQGEFFYMYPKSRGVVYGTSRMAGPIRCGEHCVSWASRTTDSQQSIARSISAVSRDPPSLDADSNPKAPSQTFFTPGSNRPVQELPMEMQSGDMRLVIPTTSEKAPPHQDPQSAPAEFGAMTWRYLLQKPAMTTRVSTLVIMLFPMHLLRLHLGPHQLGKALSWTLLCRSVR